MLILKVSSIDGAENQFETILNVNAREVNAIFVYIYTNGFCNWRCKEKNMEMEKTALEMKTNNLQLQNGFIVNVSCLCNSLTVYTHWTHIGCTERDSNLCGQENKIDNNIMNSWRGSQDGAARNKTKIKSQK